MNSQLDIYLDSKLVAHLLLQDDQLLWRYTDPWKANGFAISPHLPLLKNVSP